MKRTFGICFLIFFSSLLIGCASDRLVIPDNLLQATIELNAYRMDRYDETRLSLAGPIECDSFLWEKHAIRKATPVVSVSLGQSKKSAKIPAGKDILFVIGQNIGDRAGAIFWEMFVKPNAKYEIFVRNEFKDKFLFGVYASSLSIVVLENGTPITVNQISPPSEVDCNN